MMITTIGLSELNEWLEFVQRREQAIYMLSRYNELTEQKNKVGEQLKIVTQYLKDNNHMLRKFKNDEELKKGIRFFAGL